MGTRDDVGGDDLAEGSGGTLPGFDGSFYGGDVAADDDGHTVEGVWPGSAALS
jgi:hypothetical protein